MTFKNRYAAICIAVALCAGCQEDLPHYLYADAVVDDVREEVVASGNVSARTKVNVGSQVSGTVARVRAVLGQSVHKGEVLAELDTRMLDAQLARSRATLQKAHVERERAQLTVMSAKRTLERLRALTKDAMAAQADHDNAELAYDSAALALRAAEATVLEAQADLEVASTSRKLAVIISPIDGTIIDRQIDVGQTVAAQFQVATLYTIAQDMAQVVVLASIDEADMGHVKQGMPVRFEVDAYPGRDFAGELQIIRPAPVGFGTPADQQASGSGVVTYLAEINANNADLALYQGMTVQVHIETAAHKQVLCIPAAALRFAPEEPDAKEAPGAAPHLAARAGQGAETAPQVYVAGDAGLAAQTVRLGLCDGAICEITGGLSPGQRVAVANTKGKKSGRGKRGLF